MVTRQLLARARRPRRSLISLAGLVALAVGVAALSAGLTRPAARAVLVPGYQSTGSFSYVGRARLASSVAYPTGMVRTGAPIFLDAVRNLDVSFAYRFRSTLPHHVRGTIVLRGLLVDQGSTWHHRYRLGSTTPFTGDRATVRTRVQLHDLTKTLEELASSAGTPGVAYDLRLVPLVRVTGTVAGRRIAQTFAPTLPFTANSTVLKLSIPSPPTVPGATYALPSAASLLHVALHPSQAGTLTRRVPNTLDVAGHRYTDAALEIGGTMLVAGGAWALIAGQVRRRRQVWSQERRIAHRFGRELFDVSDLAKVPANTVVTPVPDLESLAGIARQAERPILRHATDGVAVFVVDDPPRLFRFESRIRPESARTEARLDPGPRLQLPVSGRRAKWIAGFVVAAAVVFSVSSATFTSGSVVPASYAGRSIFPRTLTQLLPPLCAGLSPVNLVVGTGASATGTQQSDLILGRNAPGAQTLIGVGGTDCIVAGGGPGTTNNFQGGSGKGDVCIGAPGAVNNYNGCEITGTG